MDINTIINTLSNDIDEIDISHRLPSTFNLLRFTNIITLELRYNNLIELPILPNTIINLDCSHNKLIRLPILPMCSCLLSI